MFVTSTAAILMEEDREGAEMADARESYRGQGIHWSVCILSSLDQGICVDRVLSVRADQEECEVEVDGPA